MFEEISAVIEKFEIHIGNVKRNAIFGGTYFHALALADAYNNLIALTDERTQQHPEVQRVPSLRYTLLQHLYDNAERHINLQTSTIFNDSLLGGPRTLREWQDAGYHTSRTTKNYDRRLAYWQSLYDDAPVQKQERVGNNSDDLFAGVTTRSMPDKKRTRIRNKVTDAPVTYEEVILRRDTRYGETAQLVPWWRALNYGTGGQGYPISPALHFVEDAERQVPIYLDKYSALFEQFISDTFDDDDLTSDDIATVESWVRQRVKLDAEYIPSFDLARQIAFGVPF